ncbi:hypothetical protein GEMRC1_009510 [Eukaryota sp. GEM-RC1]
MILDTTVPSPYFKPKSRVPKRRRLLDQSISSSQHSMDDDDSVDTTYRDQHGITKSTDDLYSTEWLGMTSDTSTKRHEQPPLIPTSDESSVPSESDLSLSGIESMNSCDDMQSSICGSISSESDSNSFVIHQLPSPTKTAYEMLSELRKRSFGSK